MIFPLTRGLARKHRLLLLADTNPWPKLLSPCVLTFFSMKSPLHKEVLWLPRWGVSCGCAPTANAASLPWASLQLVQSMGGPSSTFCLVPRFRQEYGIFWGLLEFNCCSPINTFVNRCTARWIPCAFLPSAPAGILSHPLAPFPLLGNSCSPSPDHKQTGQEPCIASLLQLCHMWKLDIEVRFVWKGLLSNDMCTVTMPDPGSLGKAASRAASAQAGNWSLKMLHQFPATHLLKTSNMPNASTAATLK